MKDSSVFPGFNTANIDNNCQEYDLHGDFALFLEEAKKFAKEKRLQQEVKEESGKKQEVKEESSKKQEENEEKKCKKKSWKSALKFWKSSADKKAKQQSKEASKGGHNSTSPKGRSHVSGPIYGATTAIGGGHWNRLAASGPLTSLFHQKKRKGRKNEIPYVSLEKLNEREYNAKTYGPVYHVS